MKPICSILFCFVLIFGAICYVKANDVSNEYTIAAGACIFAQLKSKGSLADDFPINNKPASCAGLINDNSKMQERMIFEIKDVMQRQMPNEKDCVTAEFETREKMVDQLIAATIISDRSFVTEDHPHYASLRNLLKQDLKEIAVKCRVDEPKFMSLFDRELKN